MQHLIFTNCRQDSVINKKKWRESVMGSSSQSSSKPNPSYAYSLGPSFCQRGQPNCLFSNKWQCDLEMARDLQLSGDSVRLTPTEHLASWLRTA